MTGWVEGLTDAVTASVSQIVAFLPTVILAIMLLGLGYVLARVVSILVTRLLQLMGFDRLLSRTAVQTLLERSGTKQKSSEILGLIGFWIIFLVFLIKASDTLQLTIVSDALTSIAYYIPKIGIAVLVLILGLIAANFVRELITMTCSSAGITHGTMVAQAVYVAVVLLIVVTAIDALGIDTELLNNTIVILLAGLIGGAALSFGLGSRSAVANLIAAHYLGSVVRVGMTVKIGETQGTVVAVTPISVVLETIEGRVVVPASQFTDTTAVITHPER
ncbi:MAG: mechanosensitive ion channel [Nitrospira sp.]|nr:mechanosensitive ion channel [Nitrospira sp.]MCB9711266.1 mechanosensitive ion channel [Nitrospiraceae bacterium]MDR4486728.1 mechanosensitive ion channel [Nitrospirales bacterium]MCA9464462.1 mechanosensitive ion channel [Nitrospira sp.]MCA9475505.1 mechanosensitive ion channel [Nitrospira sp.]